MKEKDEEVLLDETLNEEETPQEEEEKDDHQEEKNLLYTERMNLESQLAGSDYKVVKCAEAQALGMDAPYDIQALHVARQSARNRIAEIELELLALDGIEPTDEEKLAIAKAKKISEIDEYNVSASVNTFTVNGHPMWLNFEQRSRLKNSIDAAEAEGRESLTKVYEGMTFTYTIAVWRQMFTIVENYAGDCSNVTEQHKAAVNAMTTVADVEAFDVTADYGSNPAF